MICKEFMKKDSKLENYEINQIVESPLVREEGFSSRSTLRPFILLTLIHTEAREFVSKEIIIDRIKTLFICKSIVVSTEQHKEKGLHYHIGIWAKDSSKNTVRKKLREAFMEWDGRSINISLHKGWGTICKYIIKEDPSPLIWGECNLQQIKEVADAAEKHRESNAQINSLTILNKLEKIDDWYQIYRDEVLRSKVLYSLPRMKEAFEDLKILKDMELSILERLMIYLEAKGWPSEYDVEELAEKYLIIDWIACQLLFKRPLKTKQLFIYGEPSTQKTLLIHCLSKVLKVYFASARRNDFTGANDFYDLWVFDEFHEHTEYDLTEGTLSGSTAEGTAFVNNLLKVLDGQECRLDSKYSKVFTKKRNVPIIMIANKLPQIMRRHGPFRARFIRVRFTTKIKELEEERIIATLYGCILRRINQSPYAREALTPSEVALDYNGGLGIIIPKVPVDSPEDEFIDLGRTWHHILLSVNNPLTGRDINSDAVKWITTKKDILLVTRESKIYKMQAIICELTYPLSLF